jgi:branched-chain amino acid transport system ATP-binding protein
VSGDAASGVDAPVEEPADPILSLDTLRAGYGETEVLQGVSFDVERGEVAALIGRNGVGKTTTLRSIMGIVEPRAGTVTFDGEDVTGMAPVETAKRGIGFVPEDRRVFPGLTVEENLRMGQLGGSADSAYRRDVDEVLSTFENLRERRDNQGAKLSGGEQQMLAIARALVAGADLLLLDEPTEGLAPIIVERVQEVVEEVNDEGISILLVEQNVAVALALADHVHVLDQGRIVFSGTAEDLERDRSILDEHLGVSL